MASLIRPVRCSGGLPGSAISTLDFSSASSAAYSRARSSFAASAFACMSLANHQAPAGAASITNAQATTAGLAFAHASAALASTFELPDDEGEEDSPPFRLVSDCNWSRNFWMDSPSELTAALLPSARRPRQSQTPGRRHGRSGAAAPR